MYNWRFSVWIRLCFIMDDMFGGSYIFTFLDSYFLKIQKTRFTLLASLLIFQRVFQMDLLAISIIFFNLPHNRFKVSNKNKFGRFNSYFSMDNHIPNHSISCIQSNSGRKWQYLDKMVLVFRLFKAILNRTYSCFE